MQGMVVHNEGTGPSVNTELIRTTYARHMRSSLAKRAALALFHSSNSGTEVLYALKFANGADRHAALPISDMRCHQIKESDRLD